MSVYTSNEDYKGLVEKIGQEHCKPQGTLDGQTETPKARPRQEALAQTGGVNPAILRQIHEEISLHRRELTGETDEDGDRALRARKFRGYKNSPSRTAVNTKAVVSPALRKAMQRLAEHLASTETSQARREAALLKLLSEPTSKERQSASTNSAPSEPLRVMTPDEMEMDEQLSQKRFAERYRASQTYYGKNAVKQRGVNPKMLEQLDKELSEEGMDEPLLPSMTVTEAQARIANLLWRQKAEEEAAEDRVGRKRLQERYDASPGYYATSEQTINPELTAQLDEDPSDHERRRSEGMNDMQKTRNEVDKRPYQVVLTNDSRPFTTQVKGLFQFGM